MRLAADTVPKPVKVIDPPPAGTTALLEPSDVPVPLASVTLSVSPAHAAGTPVTTNWVKLPLLSTLRVALSDATPHDVTEALPAESACEPRARLAAAPQAANVAATASARPRIFARRFISVRVLRREMLRGRAPPPAPRPQPLSA